MADDNTLVEQNEIKPGRFLPKQERNLVAILTASGLFGAEGITSELLKTPLKDFNKIASIVTSPLPAAFRDHGYNFLAILRNQGADMAAVCATTMMGMFAVYMYALNSVDSGNEKNFVKKISKKLFGGEEGAVRAGLGFGMAVSALYTLNELSVIMTGIPDNALTSLNHKGDWSDFLVYSTPLIAGAIYLSYDVTRNAIRGIKNLKSNPHPPTQNS